MIRFAYVAAGLALLASCERNPAGPDRAETLGARARRLLGERSRLLDLHAAAEQGEDWAEVVRLRHEVTAAERGIAVVGRDLLELWSEPEEPEDALWELEQDFSTDVPTTLRRVWARLALLEARISELEGIEAGRPPGRCTLSTEGWALMFLRGNRAAVLSALGSAYGGT